MNSSRSRTSARCAQLAVLLVAFAGCQGLEPADEPPAGSLSSASLSVHSGSPPLQDLILPEFSHDKQIYRRLIYGVEEPKPVVWVVVDGTDIYCDINRNGDLTEPAERQSFDGRTAAFESGGIAVWYHKNLIKSKYQGIVQGRLFPPGGKTPETAKVFHIAGPLAVLKQEFRNRLGAKMDDFLIYVNIGTDYPGVERTEVRYECVPRDVVPELRLTYGDGSSVEHKLKKRC